MAIAIRINVRDQFTCTKVCQILKSRNALEKSLFYYHCTIKVLVHDIVVRFAHLVYYLRNLRTKVHRCMELLTYRHMEVSVQKYFRKYLGRYLRYTFVGLLEGSSPII